MPDLYPTLKICVGKEERSSPGRVGCIYQSVCSCFWGRWRGILNEDTHVEIENTGILRWGRGCV